jgi:hypothetical protein
MPKLKIVAAAAALALAATDGVAGGSPVSGPGHSAHA